MKPELIVTELVADALILKIHQHLEIAKIAPYEFVESDTKSRKGIDNVTWCMSDLKIIHPRVDVTEVNVSS